MSAVRDAHVTRQTRDHADPTVSAARSPIRVASVPSSHMYCRNIRSFDEQWDVLPDPTNPWWPPRMLTVDWILSNDFDLMHLHFGFDGLDPDDLDESLRMLEVTGKRLVYTVHDLRNPHHHTRALHDAQLEVVLSHADRVITLTPGAAEEIGERFGETPEIIPHPYVFEPGSVLAPRTDRPVVGIHLKSLRANMVDPLAIVDAAVAACRHRAIVRIDVHTDVVSREPELYSALGRHASAEWVELEVHDYFSHAEFKDYLRSLTVSVLPYRFGTHSGWLEACRDVDTRVVAPTCGHYGDQWHDVERYQNDEEDGFCPDSLEEALHRALARPLERLHHPWRRRQRAEIASRHLAIYSGLVG